MATATSRLPVDFIDLVDYHEAVDRLKLLNRGSGFGITIQRTKADKTALKQTRKVYIQCWRSRPYKSTSTGARKVTSKSTECPWRGALTKTEGGWRVEVMHDEHNHKLIEGSSPPRTIKKRQQAKVPLRTTNEFLPCQTQGALELRAEPSDGVQSTPSRLGLGPSHTPSVTPQPSPTPVHPTLSAVVPENASVISQTRSMTPPGEPLSRTTIQDYPPVFPQVASSRRRRGGYSIMSKIKRIRVPMSQRLVWAAHNPFHVEPPAFLVYHDSFNTILGDNPNLLIAYEDNMPFAHGVAIFSSQRDTVFVTSDKFVPPGHHDKTTMISKLTRKMDGSWTRDEILTFAVLTNGGTNYGNGLLFCAQGDYRDMGGIIHMEADYPHRTTVILNNYLGRRFNSLNDAVVHTDGSMWFTDPMYGFEQGLRPKPELPNQVYRFDPQTGDIRVVADGFGRPKGICFSPQEKIIYIADTDAVRGDGSVDATRPATIYAFDIIEKQHAKWLTNRRVFAMPGTGVPHSIKCDLVGNVYAACGDGLNVWNTSGVLLGKVLVPGGITSFCFGRSGELFLCSGTKFWALTVAPTVTGVLLDKIAIQAGSSMLGDAEERGSNLGYI